MNGRTFPLRVERKSESRRGETTLKRKDQADGTRNGDKEEEGMRGGKA